MEYTLDGKINHVDGHENVKGKRAFRKYIDKSVEHGPNELKIVEMLKEKDLENIVKIYKIHDSENVAFYDMEYLDTLASASRSTLTNDIAAALNQLHSNRIIYVDLKRDNMGRSEDGKWKLFDFDVSGVCSPDYMKWEITPPFFYLYKTALKKKFNIPGKTMDIDVKKYSFEGSDLREIDYINYENTFRRKMNQ